MSTVSKLIKEIANVGAGQSAPQAASAFSNVGTPFVRAGSLEFLCRGVSVNRLERINQQQAKEHRMKLYPAGTILFAKSGMSAVQNRVYVLPRPAHVVSHLATIEVKNGVNPNFLAYFWKYFKTSRLIQDPAYPSISLEAVNDVNITLPGQDEQTRIVAILDKADRLRRQRRFAQTLSDSFLQSLFIKMFGDPVANPMEWQESEIADLCESIIDCVNKTALTVDFRTPYRMIRTSNVKNGEINLSSCRFVEREVFEKWTRRSVPASGDIILTREAPLGEVGILEFEKNVFLGQRLVQYRTYPNKLSKLYLLHAFQARDLQRQLKRLSAGSTVEHVAVPDCEKLLVKVPPLPLQEKFAAIVRKFERIHRQQREATRQAEHLFQTLLHRAFSGEL